MIIYIENHKYDVTESFFAVKQSTNTFCKFLKKK